MGQGCAEMKLEGFHDTSDLLKGGVYALVYRREVVYVGKAKRMLNRVYAHLSIWAAKRKGKVPTWLPVDGIYFDEVHIRPCHPDDIDRIEREMIARYKPRLNTRLMSKEPLTAPFSISVKGITVAFNTKPTFPLIERRV